MPVRTRTLRTPPALFAFSAGTVALACLAVTRSQMFAANADLASWGVTVDLTVTVPFLYYLMVVRSGSARPMTVAAVFAAGAMFAGLIIPKSQQHFLHDLRFVVAPLELVTIALVAGKIASMRRAHRSLGGDASESIAAAARQIFGDTLPARFVASELSIVWLSVAGWKSKPDVPAGSTPITVHQKSGWGTVVVCIIVLIAAESVGMHLLLQMWSARAAWLVTALDLYGVLWLIGDYHAIRLRPSLVADGELRIRHGLRWNAAVPLASIASIERIASEDDWRRKGVLKVALVDDPRYLVRLNSAAKAHGVAGLTREFDAIAIGPDDEASISGLRSAFAQAEPEA